MQRLLANSAIILTVITAVLYFHGRNLYGGYLAYWGLGSDLFPISTEDTLMHGVNAYVWAGVEGWIYLAGIALFVIALYIVIFLLCYERPMALFRRAAKTEVVNANQKWVVAELMTFLERMFLAILAVLLFILLTGFAHNKGHQIAEDLHKKMVASKPLTRNQFEKISLVSQDNTGERETVSGYRLATSSTLCALYTQDGVRVLPIAKVVSMRIAERTNKRGEEKLKSQ